MGCRQIREYLPAYLDTSVGQRHISVDAHLQTCAGCRAELEGYREMGREMSGLASKIIEPPAWLVGTITETVSEKAYRSQALRRQTSRMTNPKVITTGAIVVAGLTGAFVVRNRRRRRGRNRLLQALSEA